MNWMIRWAGDFPLFIKEGSGARFTDVDGREYIDFCLGDTGAMTGHAPKESIEAIVDRLRRGTTFMLPTEDSIWVGRELQRRFGLPYWQVAMTATDANRFAIRLARQLTGRKLILVHNWCYHGTVDETIITINNGVPGPKPGNIGPAVDPALTTKVVEINDLAALKKALEPGDVACVLVEPALTNIGIVLPDPGYHEALRKITRETGTLLIIDETHTICAGPGRLHQGLRPGAGHAHHRQADRQRRAGRRLRLHARGRRPHPRQHRQEHRRHRRHRRHAGRQCARPRRHARDAGRRCSPSRPSSTRSRSAERFAGGVDGVIKEKGLPWHVTRLGCRAEYWFCPHPPRNGGEAAAAIDPDLDRYMHLAALNRGILHDAVPQHGADGPAGHGGGRRSPHARYSARASTPSSRAVKGHSSIFQNGATSLITMAVHQLIERR